MTTERKIASPAKIGSQWGVRVAGAKLCEVVTVRTAAGKTWDALLTASRGADLWLASPIGGGAKKPVKMGEFESDDMSFMGSRTVRGLKGGAS